MPAATLGGYDVYVLGEANNGRASTFGYWKNNKWFAVNTGGTLTDLYVEKNGQVFLTGSRQESAGNGFRYQAFYWQDSAATALDTDAGQHSNALSIAVDGGEVYVGGYEYDRNAGLMSNNQSAFEVNIQGMVWKNRAVLFRFPDVKVLKVKVIKGDVYTAGTVVTSSGRYSVIYKNDRKWIEDKLTGDVPALFDMDATGFLIARDQAVHWYRYRSLNASWQLRVGNGFAPCAACITAGHKILVVGTLQLFNPARAKFGSYAGVWHNGQFDRLETRYESRLADVSEIDGTQFFLGTVFIPGGPTGLAEQPTLWINAKKYRLLVPGYTCKAIRLFVNKK